jgi:hypothetical protein
VVEQDVDFYPFATVVFGSMSSHRSDVLATLVSCDVSKGEVTIVGDEVFCDADSGQLSSDTALAITGTSTTNRVQITNSN